MINQPYCFTKESKSFDFTKNFGSLQLYFIDSNSYAPDNLKDDPLEFTKYDWIHEDQIEWYKNQSITSNSSIAFFHIPIPEFKKATILKGSKMEGVCSPLYNSGLFDAILKKKEI